jgi:hypothetical protein
MDADGGFEIARRSRGTPRIANRLLRRVRDYADVKGRGHISLDIANRALAMLDVDPQGFDLMDRKLLEAVIHRFDGGPVGLDNIAASIGEERETIEDVIEPYLIQQGYLQRTPRGRIATLAAYRHLGVAPRNHGGLQTRNPPPPIRVFFQDIPPRGLGIEPFALRAFGGFGGFATLGQHRHAVHQGLQALYGIGLVLLLAACGLGFDDHHSVGRDALVAQGHQPFLDFLRQRRVGDGVAQVDGAGDLVDVLPARTLGADGRKIHLVFEQG